MTAPPGEGRSGALRARALRLAGLCLVVGLTAVVYASGLLRPLDDGLAQIRFQLLTRPASHSLTVVEIDPASLRAAGSWPWSRDRFARAVDNLAAAGADLVAFDVDFSARSTGDADRALQQAIQSRPGKVVLPTFVQPDRGRGEGPLQATRPLEGLSNEAVLGSVNVPVDADGRVRRYRYGFGAGEGERPSLGATLAGTGLGRSDSFLIDYGIRTADIDHLSFEAVYQGRFDPALVRGRKILIGSTALELGDEFATPKRGTLPGVYVHALGYESLIAGRALAQLHGALLLMLAGLAAYVLRPRRTLQLSKMLQRHALIGGGAILAPLGLQAVAPVSVDASPVLLAQALCLYWVTRVELHRRAQAVVEAREAHLLQLAMHMRKSRNRIRAANTKLEAANTALDKALKARTEFLASTSHEIRTPLNGILGMTQVILADRGLAPELREKVSVVHSAGETMLALVDDILDVAKIETGALVVSPVEMDLRRLLDETVTLWSGKAAAGGLALHADLDGAPARITEDPTRLRQIVFNLMSNAVKFTEQGHVTLSARVQASGAGETLALEVADTGIGIAADKLDVIFESFRQADGSVTRKYGGTGLGLAISRQLAIALGGELRVDSRLGEGSVFTLRLPLRRVAAAGAVAGAEPAERLEDACVLLVEANLLAQSMLKAALGPQVASVDTAGSMEAALQALAARRFDLVLAEGRTLAPGGEDAATALRILAAEARGARIALLWAGAAEDGSGLRAAGAHHVAQKPIATGDLVRELRTLCAGGADHEDRSATGAAPAAA